MRIVVLVFCCLLQTLVFAQRLGQGGKVRTIVIDPGHGGSDPGALGTNGHHEAVLALGVSLKFGSLVERAFPDVKVVYTRKTDKFVSLKDRADIANNLKADLFFCIHLNSNNNKEASGSSTYVLGLHKTEDNLEIAKRENAVIELEADKGKSYDFNPNSPEGHIMMSMKQNAFLDQSISIAANIENEFATRAKRKSRGVKQAGFYVLYRTSMPSLLAEIGFISNPAEEQFLSSDDGQNEIAIALFRAFEKYKNDLEGAKTSSQTESAEKKNLDQNPVITPMENQQPIPGIPIVNADFTKKEMHTERVLESHSEDSSLSMKMQKKVDEVSSLISTKPATEAEKHHKHEPINIIEETPVAKKEISTEIKKEPLVEQPKEVTISPQIVLFRIQLCAAKTAPISLKKVEPILGGIQEEFIPEKGLNRFMSLDFNTYQEAFEKKKQIAPLGYASAFIIAYQNGVRLDLKQTLELVK